MNRLRPLSVFSLCFIFFLRLPGMLLANGTPAAVPDCTTGLAGTVFIDYNADGIRDATETDGQAGLTVTVTDAKSQTATTQTDLAGRYEFTQALTYPVRLSFGALPAGLQPTLRGANNATTVQFVDAPGCGHDLALNLPTDYCQADPYITTSCFVGSNLPGEAAVVQFRASEVNRLAQPFNQPNNSQFVLAPLMQEQMLTTQQRVGSVHGLVWHRTEQAVLAGAFARINAALPGGLGAIYKLTNLTSGTATVTTLVTVPNVGSGSVAAGDVGKKGLGNLELSTDQQTLYTVNLYARTLVSIPLNGNSLGGTPLTPGTITQTPVPAPVGCPTDYRPFALRQHGGKLYVGLTCGSARPDSLKGFVYEYDGQTFTLKLTVPFTYARANVNANYFGYSGFPTYLDNNMGFTGWNTFPTADVYEFNLSAKTQPWLTDIAFDRNDMILGVRSRLADAALNAFWTIGGEVLRACADGTGGWSVENNGVCGGRNTGIPPIVNPFTGAANLRDNSYGPGGYEYYWGDDGFEGESSQGSLLQIPGRPQVFVTQSNALGHNAQLGLMKLDHTTGSMTAAGNVFYGDFQRGNNVSKANGLGALIARCDAAPIQIGNRVWHDRNRNGVQDPGEPGVPGATVALFDKTKANRLATSITNGNGEFYFSSRVASVGTATTALTGNTDFVLTLTDLGTNPVVTTNGLSLTGISPVSSAADKSINNDAVLTAGLPTIPLTTGGPGSVSHSYDFGLTGSACSMIVSVSATACDPATNSYRLQGQINASNSIGPDTARVQVVVGSQTRLVRVPLVNGVGAYSFSVATNPAGPSVGTVSVQVEGQSCPAVALPFSPPGSCLGTPAQASGEVGSFVWLDANRNARRDTGEPGVGGVKVVLWRVNAADQPAISVDSAMTDNAGNYRIKNVAQGRYVVKFDLTTFPTDAPELTAPDAPTGTPDRTDPALTSRPDPKTGQTPPFSLAAGAALLTQNAGLLPVCRPVCVPISVRRIR